MVDEKQTKRVMIFLAVMGIVFVVGGVLSLAGVV